MANKVGIEFYVSGAAQVQRDVNKIANSVGSVAKFGLKLAGVNFTAMYVGRTIRNFFADTIRSSETAVKQIDAMNSSWSETKRLIGQGVGNAMTPFYRDMNGILDSVNATIRSATELKGLFDKLSSSDQASVKRAYEEQTGGRFGYYAAPPSDMTAINRAMGPMGAFSMGTREQLGPVSQFVRPDDQILAYDLIRQRLSADALNGVSQSQQAARDKVVQLNEAMNNQIRVQQMLSDGQKNGAQILAMQAALEEGYAGDVETRTRKMEYYVKSLEKLDKIQQKIKDSEAAQKAQQDLSRMNDELDRELLIIGRLNDSHERAARMVEYERQVRIAYANSLETQNRMLEEYEQKLRAMERQEQLVQLGKQFGDAWGDALEGFAVDGRKASEVARSLAKDLQRLVFRQMVTQPLANMISQGFISMFSGGINTTAAPMGANILSSPSVATATVHTGGVPMHDRLGSRWVHPGIFAGAGYAHGGLGPGEMPAIIRKDEGVFTPGQMRALGGGSARTEGLLAELLGEMRRQGEKRMMILDRRTGVTRDEVAGIIIDDLDHAGPVATALGRG